MFNKRVLLISIISLITTLTIGIILSIATIKESSDDITLVTQSQISPFGTNNLILLDEGYNLILWNPTSGEKTKIPNPKNSASNLFSFNSSPDTLYFSDNKSNVFKTSNLPQTSNDWEKLKVKVSGEFIGLSDNSLVSFNQDKNQIVGTDLDSGKSNVLIKFEKKELNELFTSFYSLNSPSGIIYIATSNIRVIGFDPSLQTKIESMRHNQDEVFGQYLTRIVKSKLGDIYIFVTDTAKGTFFSSDFGKSFTSVQKSLENYQLGTIFYYQKGDKILGVTATGKHVYSFDPVNLTWKNIPVEKGWDKIP